MVLEVEDLQVGDHPLAVIEHLQDVFDGQIAEVETDPISRMELVQPFQEFTGCEPQEPRHIRSRLRKRSDPAEKYCTPV